MQVHGAVDVDDCLECLKRFGVRPGLVAFEALARACVSAGQYDRLGAVLKRMRAEDVPATEAVFHSVLRACVDTRSPEAAERVWGQMRRQGSETTHAARLVVFAHAVCGRAAAVRDSIDAMREQDIPLEGADILATVTAAAASHDWEGLLRYELDRDVRAFAAVARAHFVKGRLDMADDVAVQVSVACAGLLDARCRAGHLDAAQALLDEMRQEQVHVPARTLGALAAAYLQATHTEKARSLEGVLVEAGQWQPLLEAYAAAQQLEAAYRLLHQMQDRGVRPGPRVVAVLLQHCAGADDTAAVVDQALRLGLMPDAAMLHAVVAELCAGDPRRAAAMAEAVWRAGLPPDGATVNCLAGAYADKGLREELWHALSDMEEMGMGLQPETAVRVMNALLKWGEPGRAKSVMEQMRERAARLGPQPALTTALLQGYIALPDLAQADGLFDEHAHVPAAFESHSLNALGAAHLRHRDAGRAEKVVGHMREAGMMVEPRVYDGLLLAYAEATDLAKMEDVVGIMMEASGLSLSPPKLTLMLEAYLKVGAFDQARRVFKQILRWRRTDAQRRPAIAAAGALYRKTCEALIEAGERQKVEAIWSDVTSFRLADRQQLQAWRRRIKALRGARPQPLPSRHEPVAAASRGEAFLRAGQLDKAEAAIVQMRERGHVRPVVTTSALLTSYIAAQDLGKASAWFDQHRTAPAASASVSTAADPLALAAAPRAAAHPTSTSTTAASPAPSASTPTPPFDAGSLNHLGSALLKHRQLSKAEEVLSAAPAIKPEVHVQLVEAYAEAMHVSRMEAALHAAEDTGHKVGVAVLLRTVLVVYLRCMELDRARQIVCRVVPNVLARHPSQAPLIAAVRALYQQAYDALFVAGDAQRARAVVYEMESLGLACDQEHIKALYRQVSVLGGARPETLPPDAAAEVLAGIAALPPVKREDGAGAPRLPPHPTADYTEYDTYLKAQQLDKAEDALVQMRCQGHVPKVPATSAILKSHVAARDLEQAMAFFERYRTATPSASTAASSPAPQPAFDAPSLNALSGALLKQQQLSKAEEVLADTPFVRTAVYNQVIEAYGQAMQVSKMEAAMFAVKERGHQLAASRLRTVLDAYLKSAEVEKARDVVRCIVIGRPRPREQVIASLRVSYEQALEGFLGAAESTKAQKILGEMRYFRLANREELRTWKRRIASLSTAPQQRVASEAATPAAQKAHKEAGVKASAHKRHRRMEDRAEEQKQGDEHTRRGHREAHKGLAHSALGSECATFDTYLNAQQLDKAEGALVQMRERGHMPSVSATSALLRSYVAAQDLGKASAWYRKALGASISTAPDSATTAPPVRMSPATSDPTPTATGATAFNAESLAALSCAFLKQQQLSAAEEVLADMPVVDGEVSTALVQGYGEAMQVSKMEAALHAAEERGHVLPLAGLHTILIAYLQSAEFEKARDVVRRIAPNRGKERTESIRTPYEQTLEGFLGAAESKTKARKILGEMRYFGLANHEQLRAWERRIASLSTAPQQRVASEAATSLQQKEDGAGAPRLPPHPTADYTEYDTHLKAQQLDKAEDALVQMRCQGHVPKVPATSAILKSHVAARDLEQAMAFFERYRTATPSASTAASSPAPQPAFDAPSLNALSGALLKQQQLSKAEEVLADTPFVRTAVYNQVIEAYGQAMQVSKMEAAMFAVKERGHQLAASRLRTVLDAYLKSAEVEKARDVVRCIVIGHPHRPREQVIASLRISYEQALEGFLGAAESTKAQKILGEMRYFRLANREELRTWKRRIASLSTAPQQRVASEAATPAAQKAHKEAGVKVSAHKRHRRMEDRAEEQKQGDEHTRRGHREAHKGLAHSALGSECATFDTYLNAQQLDKAEGALVQMRERGHMPSVSATSALLRSYVAAQDLGKASAWYRKALGASISTAPDSATTAPPVRMSPATSDPTPTATGATAFNAESLAALSCAFLKQQQLSAAEEVLADMPVVDGEVSTALVQGYGEAMQVSKMEAALHAAEERGHVLPLAGLHTILIAYLQSAEFEKARDVVRRIAPNRGKERTESIRTPYEQTLEGFLGAAESKTKARKILGEMRYFGLANHEQLRAWERRIASLSTAPQQRVASEAATSLQQKEDGAGAPRLPPHPTADYTEYDTHLKAQQLDKAEDALVQMRCQGHVPKVPATSAILKSHVAARDLEQAMAFFERYRTATPSASTAASSPAPQPAFDAPSLNALSGALLKQQQLSKAEEVLADTPFVQTAVYQLLIRAYGQAMQVSKMEAAMFAVKERGHQLAASRLRTVLDAYLKSAEVEKARDVVRCIVIGRPHRPREQVIASLRVSYEQALEGFLGAAESTKAQKILGEMRYFRLVNREELRTWKRRIASLSTAPQQRVASEAAIPASDGAVLQPLPSNTVTAANTDAAPQTMHRTEDDPPRHSARGCPVRSTPGSEYAAFETYLNAQQLHRAERALVEMREQGLEPSASATSALLKSYLAAQYLGKTEPLSRGPAPATAATFPPTLTATRNAAGRNDGS